MANRRNQDGTQWAEALSQVLQSYPWIQLGWFFGSQLQGRARPDSDFDIAIVSDPDPDWDSLCRLREDLEMAVQAEVGLALLNRADTLICQQAISGQLLLARDRDHLADFVSRISRLHEDDQIQHRTKPLPLEGDSSNSEGYRPVVDQPGYPSACRELWPMGSLSFPKIASLEDPANSRWPALRQARQLTEEVRGCIEHAFQEPARQLSTDGALVVFGSLARGEWTSGSDVDWAFLINGPVDSKHFECAHKFGDKLKQIEFRGQPLNPPGSSGMFGKLVFSHDLVHALGGEPDTNLNTSRRLLLLLESSPLGDPLAHTQTVRAILDRYLLDEADKSTRSSLVPRLLVNDVVRFWRTLCVDFGAKHWQQRGLKWGPRNIKLRLSRKMLFVSGLLLAFGCHRLGTDAQPSQVLAKLIDLARLPPLERIAQELGDRDLGPEVCELLTIYDNFIELMNDSPKREALDRLLPEQSCDDPTFLEFKEVSQRFQELLTSIFFDRDSDLKHLIRKYGVF